MCCHSNVIFVQIQKCRVCSRNAIKLWYLSSARFAPSPPLRTYFWYMTFPNSVFPSTSQAFEVIWYCPVSLIICFLLEINLPCAVSALYSTTIWLLLNDPLWHVKQQPQEPPIVEGNYYSTSFISDMIHITSSSHQIARKSPCHMVVDAARR